MERRLWGRTEKIVSSLVALFRRPSWSPYVVGAGIGMLTWFTFGVAHKAVGISTNFSQVVRLLEEAAVPEHARQVTYFTDYQIPRVIGWEAALAVGVLLGAAWSAKLARDKSGRTLPPLWQQRFGARRWKAYALALLGGILLGYGARLAGGCTSGHALSGALQLAVSSWTFFAAFFSSGLVTAYLLFRKAE
jgi:uncharacterized membrane protein YedE/YeeE